MTCHNPDLGSASNWMNKILTNQKHYPLRGETSGGVAQCQLFSQANWQRANIILSNLSLVAKKAVLNHSFVHLFIYIFCHKSIRSLLQTLTVVSRNVAIEKINMTEHRIVEKVGGTWYHVLRLIINYEFCPHFFFSLTLMKELNFLFIYRYTHF